ncbi:MAG TPA: SRPBCC family protein [Blastocatellia bacterium]
MSRRKIVVEAIIPATPELVWERTQTPDLHLLWDIRFTHIRYFDEADDRGFQLMDYRTNIGLGIEVAGTGRYLQNSPPHHSTFEFSSTDWKSIITHGKGIWQYDPVPGGTYFKTVYDYDVRYAALGVLLDRLGFRSLMRLATEWGFETLRLWCCGDEAALSWRQSKWRFSRFFVSRLLGSRPAAECAWSWLGTGQDSESKLRARAI